MLIDSLTAILVSSYSLSTYVIVLNRYLAAIREYLPSNPSTAIVFIDKIYGISRVDDSVHLAQIVILERVYASHFIVNFRENMHLASPTELIIYIFVLEFNAATREVRYLGHIRFSVFIFLVIKYISCAEFSAELFKLQFVVLELYSSTFTCELFDASTYIIKEVLLLLFVSILISVFFTF